MSPRAIPNFDRVARLYRWAEYLLLGPLLTRTRQHFLPQLHEIRHALVLGDGDGRFAAALLLRNPSVHITALDTSNRMLDLLRLRCARAGAAGRLTTVQGSVTEATLPQQSTPFDLIATHFLLDCLTQAEVDRLARELASIVFPGALWLVSDFATPRRQPWRFLGALYIAGLYRAFRLLTGLSVSTLPDPQSALNSAGFRRLHRVERVRGLLYTELWQLPVAP